MSAQIKIKTYYLKFDDRYLELKCEVYTSEKYLKNGIYYIHYKYDSKMNKEIELDKCIVYTNIVGQLTEIKLHKRPSKLCCPDCWDLNNIESCPNNNCLMKVINKYFLVIYKYDDILKEDYENSACLFKTTIEAILGRFFIDSEFYRK